MSTVRCVIALSVTNNYKDNKNKVCKLVKSLYGLKQTPRKWNEKLVSVLKENGFVQSANDHSLFTKSKSNKFIALLVYVDDIVITGNCLDEIDKFKIFLKSKFKIKDLGHLKYFLGIEVIKTRKDLCLSQRKYCLKLLKDYSLLGCKPVSTPMEPNSVLPYVPTKDDTLLDNITGYQKLLGAPGKGIRYIHSEYKNNLSGYSDADWAKCLKTRKSITGYCVFFNNCLLSWKSKNQNTISKSSTEAEHRSLSSAACEGIWIHKLLLDLNTKVTLPINLHCDNKSALQLAINLVPQKGVDWREHPDPGCLLAPAIVQPTRNSSGNSPGPMEHHFEIDVHFNREKIAKGLLNTKKICSSNQIADILTKHLPVYQHKILCENLGMFDLFSNQIKGECSNKQ
ncbi:putative RNA-directed DNA polymerase [Tanacetum coccineum]